MDQGVGAQIFERPLLHSTLGCACMITESGGRSVFVRILGTVALSTMLAGYVTNFEIEPTATGDDVSRTAFASQCGASDNYFSWAGGGQKCGFTWLDRWDFPRPAWPFIRKTSSVY
jgi:hypothetical protein